MSRDWLYLAQEWDEQGKWPLKFSARRVFKPISMFFLYLKLISQLVKIVKIFNILAETDICAQKLCAKCDEDNKTNLATDCCSRFPSRLLSNNFSMSWFLMNKKTDEKKKKDEVKKFFLKAVSMESDGKLSKDQWHRVLTEAGIRKTRYLSIPSKYNVSHWALTPIHSF